MNGTRAPAAATRMPPSAGFVRTENMVMRRALSADAGRRFRRYWRAIKPCSGFVSRRLLRAIGARGRRDVGSTDRMPDGREDAA